MQKLIVVPFLIFSYFLSAQELGEFEVFFGPKNYKLGSVRNVSDTNIYLQENGMIHENGRIQYIYHYKNLHFLPYQIGGINFTDVLLFYESEKVTRIDILRSYVDSTEKLNDALQRSELNKIYSLLNQRSGKRGKRKTVYQGSFYTEKGYQK